MKVYILLTLLIASALAAPPKSHIAFSSGRIIGGEDAERGEHPYIISLRWTFLGFEQHVCGGTIIAPNWILTAGHCITEIPLPGPMHVIAGMTDMKNESGEEKWQKIKVVEKIVHKDYEGGVACNDIALLKLDVSLAFNQYVQKINLPKKGASTHGMTVLAGWGSISSSIIVPKMPSKLQRVDIPIVEYDACDKALTEIVDEHPLCKANICTGPLNGGTSACSGDSGGPLVQKNEDGVTQVGIVSWGIMPCGSPGAPSVYTDVASHISWINSVLEIH